MRLSNERMERKNKQSQNPRFSGCKVGIAAAVFFRTFVAELEEAVRENSDDIIITASREMKTN